MTIPIWLICIFVVAGGVWGVVCFLFGVYHGEAEVREWRNAARHPHDLPPLRRPRS